MKHSLQLKLSQHLTLTPQLQQSIRLLQLSTLELNQEIERFLQDNGLPVLTYLRDTQTYVQAAAHGMTIFDLSESRAGQDWSQWLPLIEWTTR